MANHKVYIEKNDNAYSGIINLLKKIELPDLSKKKILIKPNLGRLVESGTGVITNTEAIEGMIDFFQNHNCKNLFIGDSPIIGLKIADIYQKTGIRKLAEKKNVTLLDFDHDKPATIGIPAGIAINNLKVYNKLREFEFLVSFPVIKTHMHTTVSLSLKNLKGCLWRNEKVRLHQLTECGNPEILHKPLDMAIADMSLAIRPDLAIIDGSIALEGLGPAAGSPKKTGVFIGSCNYLFADAVAARLMGFDPMKIAHLKLAFDRNNVSLENIIIEPTDYMKYKIDLMPAPDKISINFPNIKIKDNQSCSACLSTLLVFLKSYAPHIKYQTQKDGCVTIRIGKGDTDSDDSDILLGNCSRKFQKPGNIFINGCPPISSNFFRILKERGLIDGEYIQR